ncbi:MAG: DUF2155 domain-containing protein [Pseudomonadota bacterium]
MVPVLLAAGLVLMPALAQAAADLPREVVRLRAVDKVTARVTTYDAEVGETWQFGTLEVTVSACFEAPPTEPPESAAFLVIDDRPPGEAINRVFSGWMFASSPAVSALDHAVYDVWVLDCLQQAELAAEAAEAATLAVDAAATPDPWGPPRLRPFTP